MLSFPLFIEKKYFYQIVLVTGIRKSLPARQGSLEDSTTITQNEATVIPNQESLIGDLLSMDIGSTIPTAPVTQATSNVDLLVCKRNELDSQGTL